MGTQIKGLYKMFIYVYISLYMMYDIYDIYIWYIYIYIYIYQGFPYWGNEEGVYPHLLKFCSFSPNLENLPPPSRVPPIKFLFPPPSTKQQFSKVNPIKNSIFSCSHCSCSIFVLISYSLNTQVMLILILIDVQYSQKAILRFEKRFASSKPLLLRFPSPSKNNLSQ